MSPVPARRTGPFARTMRAVLERCRATDRAAVVDDVRNRAMAR